MTQKHYTPRKHKVHGPSVVGAMKKVRIDHRTEIMVSVDVSDEEARERYLARVNASRETAHGFHMGQKHKKPEDSEEVPQEVLAAVVDDSNLPEIE